jgi:hypothetical protein
LNWPRLQVGCNSILTHVAGGAANSLGKQGLTPGYGKQDPSEQIILPRAHKNYVKRDKNATTATRNDGFDSRIMAREGSKARKTPGNFTTLMIPVMASKSSQMSVTGPEGQSVQGSRGTSSDVVTHLARRQLQDGEYRIAVRRTMQSRRPMNGISIISARNSERFAHNRDRHYGACNGRFGDGDTGHGRCD